MSTLLTMILTVSIGLWSFSWDFFASSKACLNSALISSSDFTLSSSGVSLTTSSATSFLFSSLPNNSFTLTPNMSASVDYSKISGEEISFSHLDTACGDMVICLATSSWVRPLAFLNLDNLWPNVSFIIIFSFVTVSI